MSAETPARPLPADARTQLSALLKASARLYKQFTVEVLETFGRAGEMTVRQHLRGYGRFRGGEMREAHNALGLEINMETLIRKWDSASTFVVKDKMDAEGHYSPSDTSFDVAYCPAAQAWKSEDFHRWGHVYCDEFHQSAAQTYHPDGHVVIPINMMKGDNKCQFRWVLPEGAQKVEPQPPSELGLRLARLYQATNEDEGIRLAMLRTSRLLAGRYITFTQAIRERHDEEAAQHCIERALRRWAEQRGVLLAQRHEIAGTPRHPAHLVREIEMSPRTCWEFDEVEDSLDLYECSVRQNPLDETWADYDAGDDARTFWEQVIPAMARAYDKRLRARVETAGADEHHRLVGVTVERVVA